MPTACFSIETCSTRGMPGQTKPGRAVVNELYQGEQCSSQDCRFIEVLPAFFCLIIGSDMMAPIMKSRAKVWTDNSQQ